MPEAEPVTRTVRRAAAADYLAANPETEAKLIEAIKEKTRG